MKKNNSAKRGPQDQNQNQNHTQPDKVGWIRKFCGKGIFREIWKNRFVILKGDQLYISEKEVKDEKKVQEVVDLSDYERSEEVRKAKSRSKKNHSKFTLLRYKSPGNTVPNLVFLAVSPEEKESWISALNTAIIRAKNRILDEVTVEDDCQLSHLTRDRAKIPHNRRLPTRGHLMAVASTSTSDGMLTLDLIQEEESSRDAGSHNFRVDLNKSVSHLGPDCPRSKTDSALSAKTAVTDTSGKSQSLPRETAVSWENDGEEHLTTAEKTRCSSMEEILSNSETPTSKTRGSAVPCSVVSGDNGGTKPISQLQDLISQKLQRTQELLMEVRGGVQRDSEQAKAEKLLREAEAVWGQAREVLEEVKGLRVLYQQLNSSTGAPTTSCLSPRSPSNSSKQNVYRKSMM
ncbi:pleckstrin homology domain-containing family O member 1b [Lampris incognitus]|uniref:pleckstrin homology domain-containing family O member 1b n=1 Tax=Lampris incognitus TaxID=2546036 RepID=UPI0024B51ABF|nr:pleckstrin homology domain-containing family O member 1b [Lampris incognitus]